MKKSAIKYIVFTVYILVLLKLTIFRESTFDVRKVNLKLFVALFDIYKQQGAWRFIWLFVGNLIWFVPWGMMVPMMKKSNFLIVLISGFGFSLLIEVLQFVFKKGYFEIDDLILNTIGTAIGYAGYKLLCKFCRKQESNRSGFRRI